MQRFLFALVLTVAVLSGIAATTAEVSKTSSKPAAEGIQFVELPWAKVLAKAKKEKKLIFFDAYTSWCGPCKLLQKNVFTRKDVGDFFNANFINVKKDMEIGEGPKLANVYPIEGYPSLFFINGNGKVVTSHLGGLDGPELIKFAQMVMKK